MKNSLKIRLLMVFATLIIAMLLVGTVLASPGSTTRVSISTAGDQGNDVTGSSSSISSDGRYVVFMSFANNMVSNDTNGVSDIFVRDRQSNTTMRVSVASDGIEANGKSSYYPVITPDGRYVAFNSMASNLVNGDTNDGTDIFVHDRQTGITSRESLTSSGQEAEMGGASNPSISADGRYVAYESEAHGLVPDDTSGTDIYVRDRQTNTTTRVSVSSSGVQENGESFKPSISADGRYVAFESMASNLVTGDTNSAKDIFVRDMQTNTTTRISVASDGTQGNQFSSSSSISGDGRYIVFASYADNLVSGDTNNTADIFIHDQQTSITERISIGLNNAWADGESRAPFITANGQWVTFNSNASNLVSGDTNAKNDIFVYNRQMNLTTRTSVASDGTQGNDISNYSTISNDGHFVAFWSRASNLVDGDTNGAWDVFVHENIVLAATPTPTFTPTSMLAVGPTATRTPARTAPPVTIRLTSLATFDGWVLESGENTNIGGTLDNAATTFNLGDNAAKKQYRGIVSFNTSSLPDNATISAITLRVKQNNIVGGGNPVAIFGGFLIDIKNGFFANQPTLQVFDFQAAASKTLGPANPAPVSGFYNFNLITGKNYINKLSTHGGLTQIRLRFSLDDNNNAVANYLSLFSGNAPAENRPQLVITYTIP